MVKFCTECGTELIKKGNNYICPSCTIFCSKCGAKNSTNTNYCEKCGNPIIQVEKDDSSLDEARSKEKVATSDNLIAGKRAEVEDFNIPFDGVWSILEEHMEIKLKKLILKDRKNGELIYVMKDYINASLISMVSGKAGTEIHIQINPITKNKTRIKIIAKPTGIALGPSFLGSRKRIKEIFKKINSKE